jgi:hypothetical protein
MHPCWSSRGDFSLGKQPLSIVPLDTATLISLYAGNGTRSMLCKKTGVPLDAKVVLSIFLSAGNHLAQHRAEMSNSCISCTNISKKPLCILIKPRRKYIYQ